MPFSLVFVVALPCEAKPLIHYYRLKRRHDVSAYKLFERKGTRLIISGVGKVAAASAVGFIAGRLGDAAKTSLWLNVGVARHPTLEIGTCCWVNKVLDLALQKSAFPKLCIPLKNATSACVTVDKTAIGDEGDGLFDMEASGFFFAASKHATLEQVQALKVVSDNQEHSPEQLNSSTVTALIEEALPPIEAFIQPLISVLNPYHTAQKQGEAMFERITAMHHCTQSTRIQLKRLIERIHARKLEGHIHLNEIEQLANAKAVIRLLEKALDNAPVLMESCQRTVQ